MMSHWKYISYLEMPLGKGVGAVWETPGDRTSSYAVHKLLLNIGLFVKLLIKTFYYYHVLKDHLFIITVGLG